MLRTTLVMIASVGLVTACSQQPEENKQTVATEEAKEAVASVETSLIPRELLFGNADKWQGRISPDGKHLSWLAPVNGVQNIWLAPIGNPAAAKAVTSDTGRGIQNHLWALDSQSLLYTQDSGGNENDHIYSVNIETGELKDLTDIPEDARAVIQGQSLQRPSILLAGLNTRNPQLFDLYEINVVTGERTMVMENPGFAGWVIDNNLNPVMGLQPMPDGSSNYVKQVGDQWETFMTVPAEDALTTGVFGFDKDNSHLYAIDSRGRDKAALVKISVETGDLTVIAESDKADVNQVFIHPQTREIMGYSVNYLKTEWAGTTDEGKADFAAIAEQLTGDYQILASTNDGNRLVMYSDAPQAPGVYYIYDRTSKKVSKMFDTKAELASQPLVPMYPLEIPSRDGKTLVSYLSLPASADQNQDGVADMPVPMVLTVHGGPWARDSYGFNTWHQWLTNRGYAVLSVNYRGSTGFGKDFVNAAVGEFAGKMHDDLIDAVDFAIAKGVTEKDTVAIMGGSYGGYATLIGLTFTPDRFACGVDIVGPSSLVTLVESFPAYWGPFLESTWYKYVGNPEDPAQREDMLNRSAISRIDAIKAPLLIGQGENDPRVTKLESDQMVEAMEAAKKTVTYVNFPDEGHGFARPENSKSFSAITEGFLAECLGGKYEPIGNDFDNSSLQVLAGEDNVKGLKEALNETE